MKVIENMYPKTEEINDEEIKNLKNEADKIYFRGWNDHLIDHRTARNFDKTEYYFGKRVADYCRVNNISSLWTDIPRDALNVTNPWEH